MDIGNLGARVAALEATNASLERQLASALGEATFAGVLITPLIVMLVKAGMLAYTDAAQLVDTALLMFERQRAAMALTDLPAIDHARLRLVGLLKILGQGAVSAR